MWTAILAIFPTIAGWINQIIGFFQLKARQQTDQNSAVDNAMAQHNSDGAQSVADKTSSDLQNQEIDKEIQELDHAPPIEVTPPTKDLK